VDYWRPALATEQDANRQGFLLGAAFAAQASGAGRSTDVDAARTRGCATLAAVATAARSTGRTAVTTAAGRTC
jgi:hypothetical protein